MRKITGSAENLHVDPTRELVHLSLHDFDQGPIRFQMWLVWGRRRARQSHVNITGRVAVVSSVAECKKQGNG